MIEILFSLNQISLGLWCLQFVNQFIHPYTFCFLPFFFLFIAKALMKGSMNAHCPFCNYRKILKMHLKVTCCCNVSDTDILYQNMSFFSFSDLHFFAGQWEVSAAVRCSSLPLSFMFTLWAMYPLHGGVWHWTKPSQEGQVRSSSWEQELRSPLEMMSKSMYYRLYQYITQINYLFTSVSKRIITIFVRLSLQEHVHNFNCKILQKTWASLSTEATIVWQQLHFQCLPFRWQIPLTVWTEWCCKFNATEQSGTEKCYPFMDISSSPSHKERIYKDSCKVLQPKNFKTEDELYYIS